MGCGDVVIVECMIYDAVILTGGRSSRLGGQSKGSLRKDGATLLDRILAAAHGARRIVVVGDDEVPSGVLRTREHPPFGGPAAAIAAGRALLRVEPSDYTLVLACDVPDAAGAVDALLAHPVGPHGSIAIDADDRDQYLLALYASEQLDAAISTASHANASVRSLVQMLELERVRVPIGSTDDVDTWDDAERLGIAPTVD